ncbi:hypothetical protein [Agaribacterium sp. ZY112]|uniref:hypothetical protein n=1 Tax=Agaribacterium sp. ZY112 TaxID=3233574 RepID=UPI003523DDA9
MNTPTNPATIISLQSREEISLCDASLRHRFELRRNKPMAIIIDAQQGLELLAEQSEIGLSLQKELKLWHKALGRRKISCIELHYSGAFLHPFDITGIIHGIASKFDISDALYRVVLSPDDAQTEVLALLRGLSFQHCQLAIEHAQSDQLQMLEEPIDEARTYKFARVGVQIQHSEGVENLRKSIRVMRDRYSPDYIYIGSTTYPLGEKDIEQQTTLFKEDLIEVSTDHLNLGPGASSKFGSLRLTNFSDIGHYLEEIEKGQLPLHQRPLS